MGNAAPALIHDWEELDETCNESDTHIVKINREAGNGWLKAKYEKAYDCNKEFLEQVKNQNIYLSTHSFYESQRKATTRILQECGFNVVLVDRD
ncbi:MAG: hypothetical protein RSF40_01490 [Oscillospiraceae bacterium]